MPASEAMPGTVRSADTRPYRQVRAVFDEATITVYQAYKPEIALDAIRRGRLPASYDRTRMTWIKPSFVWMMYRSGWAAKPDQEHVLAIRLTRAGFETALGQSALSHFDPAVHASQQEWAATRHAPVRIQWDPERDLHLRPLGRRAIQIGLSGPAVHAYCDEWIAGIDDATALAHEIHALVRDRAYDQANALLPAEAPYPLPAGLAASIGATAEKPGPGPEPGSGPEGVEPPGPERV
jgi:hypothetical protein